MVVTTAQEYIGLMEGVSSAAGNAAGNSLIDTDLNRYVIPGLLGSTVVVHPANPLLRDVLRVTSGGGGILTFSTPYRLGAIAANTPYQILISRAADYNAERIERNQGSFEANTLFKTLAACIGDPVMTFATEAIAARAAWIAAAAAHGKESEQMLEKTDGTVPNGDDNLFVVAGGPILVTNFFGLVTTLIGNNAATCTIQHANTDPAADIALSTAVNVETDAVGTSYYITSAGTGVFTPVTPGSIIQATQMLPWLLMPGTLQATFSAANTGAIRWFLVYKRLSVLSVVTMAP